MDLFLEIIRLLAPGLGLAGLLGLAAFYSYDTLRKWGLFLLAIASRYSEKAKKMLIKFDLELRTDLFVKSLERRSPNLETVRLKIEWIDDDTDRQSFIRNGEAIIWLRRSDPQDQNFVHSSFLFVSSSLLYRVKRYLSKNQSMAIDLFVTSQLIAEQKPEVQHFFIDKYLFPNTRDKDSKINVAMSNFETLNRAGLFFPVLLQELDFLGLKVFGKRKDTLIHSDVYGLIDFLLTVAERKIGEEIDLNYQQEYCNCAIVIVGKPYKISVSTSPYIKWIEGVIRDDNVESVYLIGLAKNQDFINQVCSGLDGLTEKVAEYEGEGELHYSDASTVRRDVFVATLRSKGIPIYSGER